MCTHKLAEVTEVLDLDGLAIGGTGCQVSPGSAEAKGWRCRGGQESNKSGKSGSHDERGSAR